MIDRIPNTNRKAIQEMRLNKANGIPIDRHEYPVHKRMKSLADFPDYVRTKLENVIRIVLIKYPMTQKIYLSGSYAYGLWKDEKVDNSINRPEKKRKLSDFDIIPIPTVKKLELIETDFGKIDIMYDSHQRWYQILIWEKQ